VHCIADFRKWSDDENEDSECEEPSEGPWDSHEALMNVINDCRLLSSMIGDELANHSQSGCVKHIDATVITVNKPGWTFVHMRFFTFLGYGIRLFCFSLCIQHGHSNNSYLNP
jgi:hypothetical protein